MKIPTYIERPFVAPVDLQVLGQTYSTLEQGHQQAVKASSDLQVAMAQLDLNEAEDVWRQNKINEIRNTIDANTIYGNSAGAVDDIVALSGNLMSDQGLIGRLEAQKAYKSFQDNIDKNPNITERDKRYYKAHNQYKYNDIVDEKGNVIGGSEWTPDITPIAAPDYGALVIKAANLIKPRTGTNVTVRYINDKGEVVSENDPTAKPEYGYYDMTTSSYVTIPRKEIEKAVQGLIRSTPEFFDAVKRDKDIAYWDYQEQLKDITKYNTEESRKQLGVSLGVTNNVGRELSVREYIAHKMDPLIDAATYYNSESKTQYGQAYKQYNKIRNNKNGYRNLMTQSGIDSSVSYPIVYKDESLQDATLSANIYKQKISDLLGNKYDITDMSDQDIYDTKEYQNLSPIDKTQMQYAIAKYQENQKYIDSKKENLSVEEQDKLDAYYAINTGYKGELLSNDGENNNQYYQKFQNIINEYYQGAKAIRQYTNHVNGEKAFYLSLGDTVDEGKQIARDLGIVVGKNRGMTYFELPSEYANNLPAFANAAKAAYNEHSAISFTSQKSKLFTVDDSGNEQKLRRGTSGDISFSSAAPTIVFADLDRELDSLKIDVNESLNATEDVTYIDNVFHVSSPKTAMMTIMGADDKEIKAQTEADIMAIQGSFDAVNTGMYVLGEDNFLTKVDAEQRQKYGELLRNANPNNIIAQMRWDPVSNQYGTQITIQQNASEKKNVLGKEDKQPVVIFIPNNSNRFENDIFNSDPTARAADDLITYADKGMDVEIGNDDLGYTDIYLHSNGNSYSIIENSTVNNIITKEEGIAVRAAYINLQDLVYQYMNGLIDETELLPSVTKYVAIMGMINNSNSYNSNPEEYTKNRGAYLLKRITNNYE